MSYKNIDLSYEAQVKKYLKNNHSDLSTKDRDYAIKHMVKACDELPENEIQFTHLFNQLFQKV